MTLPACAHTRDEMPGADSKLSRIKASQTHRPQLGFVSEDTGDTCGRTATAAYNEPITRALRLSETLTQRERRIKEFSSDATSLLAWQSNAAGLKSQLSRRHVMRHGSVPA